MRVAAVNVLSLILPTNFADNKTRIGLICFPFLLIMYLKILSKRPFSVLILEINSLLNCAISSEIGALICFSVLIYYH